MKNSLLLAVLAALCVFSNAISTQTEEISVSASEVSSLVRVQSSFSFEQLIPGKEYSTQVIVEWNIPQVSLKNLAENKVVLHVKAEPRVEDSWVYFKKAGQRTAEATALQLVCFVENGECTRESVLSQTFTAFYRAPTNAVYPHDDGLRVIASLEAQQLTPEELRAERQAFEKIIEYEKRILEIAVVEGSGGAAAGTAAQLRQLIEEARELLNEKRLGELQQKISQLEAKISEIPTPTPIRTEASVEPTAQATSQAVAREPSEQTGFATASSAAAVGLVVLAVLGYAVWWKLHRNKKPNSSSPPEQAKNGPGEWR